jgi:hypothetical protein
VGDGFGGSNGAASPVGMGIGGVLSPWLSSMVLLKLLLIGYLIQSQWALF